MNLLLQGICLLFPILFYLSLLVPIKDFSIDKNKLYFSLSLFLSLFLLFTFKYSSYYETTILYIPIIVSSLLKRECTSFYLSLTLLIYFHDLPLFPFLMVLLELFSYFLIEKVFSRNINFKKIYIVLSSLIKSIFLIINKTNFIYILVEVSFFVIYINLILKLLRKNNYIIDFSFREKQLDKEKNLKTSIFKLTHELKNPLAVCNGYLEMMDLSNESKTKRYFTILKDEIKRSLTIINDFSSFGKIKKIEREELDIYYLLEEIKDTLSPMFNSKNANIIIEDDKEVYLQADYSRLKQVFVNLLKNALEAKDKETIFINIKAKELKDKVKVTIKDNGCGMTKEELNHIGDTFYTTKENGTGLGLSYCKEIIDLHGGNIIFKSIKEKGTTVTLYFPKI